jgi:hypothetical protein
MAVLTSDGHPASDEEIAAMFRLPAGTAVATSAEPARWVEEALAEGPFVSVRGEIPATFEAYARVLHPAQRAEDWTAVRWAEVAAETGGTVHRLMQFERVAGLPPYTDPAWGTRPREGDVCAVAGPLLEVLRRQTTTPDRCVLGIWEGYGGQDMVPWLMNAPRLSKPREYLLLEGPADAVIGFCQQPWNPPSVWWPSDRAWFVATDIDIDSTYVGGSRACVDAILEHPALESFPAEPDDPIHGGADQINPPVAGEEPKRKRRSRRRRRGEP